jgi:hypothetical protein
VVPAQVFAIEGVDGDTTSALEARARSMLDGLTSVDASVDGVGVTRLGTFRMITGAFDVSMPPDNVLRLQSGARRVVAGGYFVVIPRLAPGKHVIRVSQAFNFPFQASASYTIRVKAPR